MVSLSDRCVWMYALTSNRLWDTGQPEPEKRFIRFRYLGAEQIQQFHRLENTVAFLLLLGQIANRFKK